MGAHAGFHLAVATVSSLLVLASLWVLPLFPPGWIGRAPRAGLLGGLALLSGGQAVEPLGAASSLATVHDVGVWASAAATTITIFGTIMRTVVMVARHFDRLNPRWVTVGLAVAAIGSVAFVVGGIVLGY